MPFNDLYFFKSCPGTLVISFEHFESGFESTVIKKCSVSIYEGFFFFVDLPVSVFLLRIRVLPSTLEDVKHM